MQGNASVEQLQTLLDQVPSIGVDLSEYSGKIRQAVRLYCVCKTAWRPPMVQCSSCRVQMHAACVGYEPNVVDPVTRTTLPFVCLECCVRS